MNKQRLLDFLPNFLADRTEDDQFSDEKSYLIKQIKNLPSNPTPSAPRAPVNGHGESR